MAVGTLWPMDSTSIALAFEEALEESVSGRVQPHTEYQTDPIGWIRDKLGVPEETLRWSLNDAYGDHEWDGTEDPLAVILGALAAGNDVGVESGTGTGKTFLGACVVLWFLACWEDAIVVTAAPKQDQLKLHIWKEIGRLFPRFRRHFPDAQLLDGKLRMKSAVEDRETWAATAFVCGVGADEASATKAQGFHAEHMLIITEETPGIHPAIMVAFENTSTAPHNLRLALGNPDHQEDELHYFCTSPGVTHVRVSALDHPNVVCSDPSIVPGAVGQAAVDRRRQLYEPQPAMFDSRVRGISPKQAAGVALEFNEADHMESMDADALQAGLAGQKWEQVCGIDFGYWRFAFVHLAVDRAKRVHVVQDYFDQKMSMGDRAEWVHEYLTDIGAPKHTPIWGDQANPQQIMEMNKTFREIKSPYRVRPVMTENKARKVSVERLNKLLGHGKLLFRRGMGLPGEWRRGMSTISEGHPMIGSRLLWEIRRWRYPDPREGQAQKDDPDDNTADGADAIAALRYAIMSWWKGAEVPDVPQKKNRNRDEGLEKMLARMAEMKRRETMRRARGV